MSPKAIRELFERAPVTVRAYVAIAAVRIPVSLVVGLPDLHNTISVALWPLTGIIALAFLLFLLRRSRVVWVLLVIGGLGTLPIAIADGRASWWLPLNLVEFALLLWPSTWRFIWRDRPRPEPAAGYRGSGSERHDSGGRRIGWHVDPENPARMNYWHGTERGWSSSSKTPRKVRREWEQVSAAARTNQALDPD